MRVRYIDGLRACAVLGVLACHAALLMPAWANIETVSVGIPWYWLGHVLVDGAHGVDLFFILSGFCLAYPTLARLRTDGSGGFDLARFAAHRVVRIVPRYLLAIVAFAILGAIALVHGSHRGTFMFPNAGAVPWSDVARQALFLDLNTTMVNSNFWTLAVEFRWYFVFPLCLLAWSRMPRLYVALIVAAVFAYAQTRLYNIDLGVLPAFMLGVVAADLEIRRHPVRAYALPLTVVALALGFALEPSATMPAENHGLYRSFFLQSNIGWHLAAFFFVLAAGYVRPIKAALSQAALVTIGVASYSIYLMHAPLMFVAAARLPPLRPGVAFIALVGVGLAAGFAFWWLAERHFTHGPIRDRLHAILRPRFATLCARLEVPVVLDIGTGHVKEPIGTTGEAPFAPARLALDA